MRYPTLRVTFSPASGDTEVFDEVYTDLLLSETDKLTEWTGMDWADWFLSVDQRKPDSLRFLYWLARKRSGSPVEGRFSEIDFYLHELASEIAEWGDFAPKDDGPIEVAGPDPTPGVVTGSD